MSADPRRADPVVSPADTIEALASDIRLFLQRSMPIQCPAGVVRPPLAALAALLAVGERDKADLANALHGKKLAELDADNERRILGEVLAERERDRRQIARLTEALTGIGWMPCAESPYWCFCKEPSEPGSHHGDGCIVASGLLALAGRCGSDGDKPTPDTLTDSLGRSLTELQVRAGKENT